LRATVKVTELSGSESFVHFDCGDEPWVALLAGNHNLAPGETISLYVSPAQLMVFDSNELALTRVAA
jgi:glycerol transport system ATP-binding protein